MTLKASQSAAIRHVETFALQYAKKSQQDLEPILKMSNISLEEYEAAKSAIRTHSRVALHFHPDRIIGGGGSTSKGTMTVAQSLLADGKYNNQFDTHLSNGKLDPTPNGSRAKWEDDLFGGAFAAAELSERPKYGALNLMQHPDGPCPRFGSCYFVLRPEVSQRCTFSYGDSHTNPFGKGTLQALDLLMAELFKECFERRFALGTHNISPSQLMHHLINDLMIDDATSSGSRSSSRTTQTPAKVAVRNLNHYIESQIHGDLDLRDDVTHLVADPSFMGGETGDQLKELCQAYDIQLQWHCGFWLPAPEVPKDFRGPTMPLLAQRIVAANSKNSNKHTNSNKKDKDKDSNVVNALVIGQAARDVVLATSKQLDDDGTSTGNCWWQDCGSVEEVLQELKYLWHVLVQFGYPIIDCKV